MTDWRAVRLLGARACWAVMTALSGWRDWIGVFGCLVWVDQTGFVEATSPSLYKGHRYPMEIISHRVWLYHRFPLSLREVEEMMLARGVLVTYETVHQWCRKFGQTFANGLRRRRARPGDTRPGDKWHLDEMFIKIKIKGKGKTR